MPIENLTAYHAAELFNLPSRLFNETLVNTLESKGLRVFSPQRDGFEFAKLNRILSQNKLPPELIDQTMNTIIYAYDIFSISKSDLLVARFDEPQDPGVNAEVLIANSLNIPTICYRTDIRSPYGSPQDKHGGMHPFPIKTSDVFIIQSSSDSAVKDLQNLTDSVINKINELNFVRKPAGSKLVIPDFLKNSFHIANVLFEGIGDIHSQNGLDLLVNRCLKNQEIIGSFGPTVIRI